MITQNIKTLKDLLAQHGRSFTAEDKKEVWQMKGLDKRLGSYKGTAVQIFAFIKSLKNNPITPAPGWRINPNNPNEVIRDTATGYSMTQPVQPAPQVVQPTAQPTLESITAGVKQAQQTFQQIQAKAQPLLSGTQPPPTPPATPPPVEDTIGGGTTGGGTPTYGLSAPPTPTAADIEGQVTGSAAYKSFQDYLDKLTGIQTAQSEAEKAGLESKALATTKTTEENLAARGLAFSGIRTQEISNIASNLMSSKLGVDRDLATNLLNANQKLASYVTAQVEELVKDAASDNQKARTEALGQLNQAGYSLIGGQLVPTLAASKAEAAEEARAAKMELDQAKYELSVAKTQQQLENAALRLELAQVKYETSSAATPPSVGFFNAKTESSAREDADALLTQTNNDPIASYRRLRLLYSPQEVSDEALKNLVGFRETANTLPDVQNAANSWLGGLFAPKPKPQMSVLPAQSTVSKMFEGYKAPTLESIKSLFK